VAVYFWPDWPNRSRESEEDIMKTITAAILVALSVSAQAYDFSQPLITNGPVVQPRTQPSTVWDTRGGQTSWTTVTPSNTGGYSIQRSDGSVGHITTQPDGNVIIWGLGQ
jgi:hypothetical protein